MTRANCFTIFFLYRIWVLVFKKVRDGRDALLCLLSGLIKPIGFDKQSHIAKNVRFVIEKRSRFDFSNLTFHTCSNCS